MKSKYFKSLSLLLAGIIVFSACEDDKDSSPNLGDAVGKWQLVALDGLYTRTVVTGAGIANSADVYKLVANWKDAAGFAAATGADPAAVAFATNFTLSSWTAGDAAPGFPRPASFDANTLAALGISMTVELLDSKSKDSPGTYNVNGTYPSLRLNPETCTTYLMVPPPQINDTGDWSVNYETKKFTLAPAASGDYVQVLPPFSDGDFMVNREVEPATFNLTFLDRDSHDSKYSEVTSGAWNEAGKRVITGISGVPVNAGGGWDSNAPGDPVAEAYIMQEALAPWGGYLTWYSFNIVAEATVKAADVKNPLIDLTGDGKIDATDMIVYMHADNLASGGGVTSFGMPYAVLVNSTNPAAPVPVNDSGSDFALAGLATGAGGKLQMVINDGTCIPVNETINFVSNWTEVAQ